MDFPLAGDGGSGRPERTRFASRHRRRRTRVSRFGPDANLSEPPSVVVGKRHGRPRKQGATRSTRNVPWDGDGRRDGEVVSATGQGDKSGVGLVPIRWAFVPEGPGTQRDDSVFSTDPAMTPCAVSERIPGRWSIEKGQAHNTSSGRWCAAPGAGYDRRRRAA